LAPDVEVLEPYQRKLLNFILSSVILNNDWHWGSARSDYLVTIISKLPLVDIGECDKASWTSSKSGSFSIANAWDQIRTKDCCNMVEDCVVCQSHPKVCFHHMVSNEGSIINKGKISRVGD
jgi:hypothetical protein